MKNPDDPPRDAPHGADILLASLIGDALALGPHWVYDQEEIRSQLGRVTSYHAPLAKYHSGKLLGDLTHYGDQTLILLRSVAEDDGFDLKRFADRWRAFWEDPKNISYRDGATRETLEHLQAGLPPESAGSDSHDIAGAARIGPLFLLPWKNDESLIEATRCETAFTHPNEDVVESAGFFCRVILAVRAGTTIPEALDSARVASSPLPEKWLAAARTSARSEVTDSMALKTSGLRCHTAEAFPGICHLLLRYPEDPTTALIENAAAGGDNAARGMILGLVYGAKFPVTGLPTEWLSNLNARREIARLVGRLRQPERTTRHCSEFVRK